MSQRILILAPHTDDGEFGCGGTIARLVREGHTLKYVAFSDCAESIPDGFPKDVLGKEMFVATKHLGITDVSLLNYKVRKFNFERQRILEDMIKIKKAFKPQIIFTPCTNDIHQDHTTITQEAKRAFKQSTIYGYELPWNNIDVMPSTSLFKIEEHDLNAKIEAIREYKSQGFRPYSDLAYIKALAITRGTRIGVDFAEAFQVIKYIEE